MGKEKERGKGGRRRGRRRRERVRNTFCGWRGSTFGLVATFALVAGYHFLPEAVQGFYPESSSGHTPALC